LGPEKLAQVVNRGPARELACCVVDPPLMQDLHEVLVHIDDVDVLVELPLPARHEAQAHHLRRSRDPRVINSDEDDEPFFRDKHDETLLVVHAENEAVGEQECVVPTALDQTCISAP
jgi:hypothetical protein